MQSSVCMTLAIFLSISMKNNIHTFSKFSSLHCQILRNLRNLYLTKSEPKSQSTLYNEKKNQLGYQNRQAVGVRRNYKKDRKRRRKEKLMETQPMVQLPLLSPQGFLLIACVLCHSRHQNIVWFWLMCFYGCYNIRSLFAKSKWSLKLMRGDTHQSRFYVCIERLPVMSYF